MSHGTLAHGKARRQANQNTGRGTNLQRLGVRGGSEGVAGHSGCDEKSGVTVDGAFLQRVMTVLHLISSICLRGHNLGHNFLAFHISHHAGLNTTKRGH